MLYGGRVMSISYRIEVQLNKKVRRITLKATVIKNWRTTTYFSKYYRYRKIHVVFGNKISLGETFFCKFKNRVEDGKRDVTASYCVFRARASKQP